MISIHDLNIVKIVMHPTVNCSCACLYLKRAISPTGQNKESDMHGGLYMHDGHFTIIYSIFFLISWSIYLKKSARLYEKSNKVIMEINKKSTSVQ